MRLFLPSLALLCALLASCAASSDYPSLALRDAERAGGENAALSTDGLALVDSAPPWPEVRAQIDGHVAAARAAHRRFLDALPGTRRAVANGSRAPVDSNAYAAAQIALGNLQSIRSGTAFALADLDALLATRSNALQSTEKVSAARSAVAALLQEENAALDALQRQVR